MSGAASASMPARSIAASTPLVASSASPSARITSVASASASKALFQAERSSASPASSSAKARTASPRVGSPLPVRSARTSG